MLGGVSGLVRRIVAAEAIVYTWERWLLLIGVRALGKY